MTDVTAAELTEARADLEAEILPDTATIFALTEAPDGEGGSSEDWAPLGSSPCRIDPYGGPTSSRGAGGEGASHAAERVDSRTSHIVTFPAETGVSAESRLEIAGVTYEVLVLRRSGAWELSRRVEVKEKL
jgi:hypothetical protein